MTRTETDKQFTYIPLKERVRCYWHCVHIRPVFRSRPTVVHACNWWLDNTRSRPLLFFHRPLFSIFSIFIYCIPLRGIGLHSLCIVPVFEKLRPALCTLHLHSRTDEIFVTVEIRAIQRTVRFVIQKAFILSCQHNNQSKRMWIFVWYASQLLNVFSIPKEHFNKSFSHRFHILSWGYVRELRNKLMFIVLIIYSLKCVWRYINI